MNTLKYYNYNRKSTDSEDKQILSLPAQEEAAREIAATFHLSIAAVINESKSAKIPSKRDGFSRMITAIRKGHCNAILCWKLDRLARNMEEGGILIELLQQGKIREIRTPGKTYLPNENAIVMAVEFGSANQYSRELSENIRRGLRNKASMGVPNGVAPFGYLNEKTGEKGTRRWKPDYERIQILRAIFTKLLTGTVSARSIYRWATETYHPTTVQRRKRGGRKLAESSFYTMLRDTIYAGFFIYEGVRYELDSRLPRVISESEFYRVQRILDGGTPSKMYRHEAMFAGFIKSPAGEYVGPEVKFQVICDCKYKFSYINRTRCPVCGAAISELLQPKYLQYTYYYNVSRRKRRESTKMLAERRITLLLGDFLNKLRFSSELKQWFKECAEKAPRQGDDPLKRQRRTDMLKRLEAKRKRLRDLVATGVISPEEYTADIQEIDSAVAELREETDKRDERYSANLDAILNAYDGLITNDREHIRALLHDLGLNLVWDEKKLDIKWPEWILEFRKGMIAAMSKNPRFEPESCLAGKDPEGVFSSVSHILSRTLENVRKSLYVDNG